MILASTTIRPSALRRSPSFVPAVIASWRSNLRSGSTVAAAAASAEANSATPISRMASQSTVSIPPFRANFHLLFSVPNATLTIRTTLSELE